MKGILSAVLAIIFLSTSISAVAHEEMSPAKEQDIRRLLEFSGSQRIIADMVDAMKTSMGPAGSEVPEEFWDALTSEESVKDFIDLVVPVYAKHLSHKEVKAILKFYKSPAGKKLVQVQPEILKETFKVGEQWGLNVSQRLLKQFQNNGQWEVEPTY